jgi:hypothetical protein
MRQDGFMIGGPKYECTYIVGFTTAEDESFAVSVPQGETAALKHFQALMPYGVVVPDAEGR